MEVSVYMNKRGKKSKRSSIPYGITWRLVLLKDSPKPPRPFKVYVNKKISKGKIN
jgi:hypothetical protein